MKWLGDIWRGELDDNTLLATCWVGLIAESVLPIEAIAALITQDRRDYEIGERSRLEEELKKGSSDGGLLDEW